MLCLPIAFQSVSIIVINSEIPQLVWLVGHSVRTRHQEIEKMSPLSMQRWRGKVAVVTGASSGIGEAIARRLVAEGLQVIGLARRDQKIRDIAETLNAQPGQLHAFKCDLTQEKEILEAFKWVEERFGVVNLLVNNAGVIGRSSLCEGATEEWRRVLETNVLGLSVATREAIRIMRGSGVDEGDVVHIGSIAGRFVFDMQLHMYYAAKHAVTAMTEVIRRELIGLGSKIRVTSLLPGVTDTPLFENSEMPTVLEQAKQCWRILDPVDVADALIYVLSTPPHVHVQELMIRSIGESV